MVNNLRIYMYNSRLFVEKYIEIYWCIDILIGINFVSSNFCLLMMELYECIYNYIFVYFILY